MTWFEAVVLGVIQGLTEFLPVSSSAHILVLSRIFGWGDPGAAFTAVTQIGTEAAVLIYFRHDIARIISAWARSLVRPESRGTADARLGWYVILGTVPIVVLGLADRFGRKEREITDMRTRDAIGLGLAQALALIPGVSRSGATITMGLTLGYTREAATRYAFLLAIPAVLGSGFYEATRIGDDPQVAWGQTIVATAIAFAVGYAVIAWLLRYLRTGSYLPFVAYRLALAALIVGLLVTGTITAT